MKIIFLLLLSVSCFLFSDCATAQSIGFWNVENLFDTIDTPLHDDGDFTPRGRFRWSTARYHQKIENIARVLDEMHLDVVGLCEVEGENALRDLIRATKTDYAYLWLPTGDPRGIDQALLYKGDKFYPDAPRMIRSGTNRGFLYVRGLLAGERVDLLVCHLPSQLNSRTSRRRAADALQAFVAQLETDPEARVMVIGDLNTTPDDELLAGLKLHAPLPDVLRQGGGSYVWDGRWLLYDHILVSDSLADRIGRRGVFIREFLLQDERHPRPGQPLRSFSGRTYLRGYSDHLPVYIILKKGF